MDDGASQIRNLKYMLPWFQMISGLKTIFSKSSLFGVGEVQDLEGLTEIMECSCSYFSNSYLGMRYAFGGKD